MDYAWDVSMTQHLHYWVHGHVWLIWSSESLYYWVTGLGWNTVRKFEGSPAFNLSFESMTSHEALHTLRDVQKNEAMALDHIKTAQYRVETPEADEEAEPPFAQAADVDLDHIALGELSVPEGYSADGLGNLMAHNEAESYE
ncbi:hypothetical protein F4604DRAFT_1685672 [Suillus subluteus]|nr:hypothetical protein F4604DRAFT_1685672 [Suillus subluteus]